MTSLRSPQPMTPNVRHEKPPITQNVSPPAVPHVPEDLTEDTGWYRQQNRLLPHRWPTAFEQYQQTMQRVRSKPNKEAT